MATVEIFSLWLCDADAILAEASQSPQGISHFEASLTKQLTGCQRLIRWAFIKTRPLGSGQREILCQGAYLKLS